MTDTSTQWQYLSSQRRFAFWLSCICCQIPYFQNLSFFKLLLESFYLRRKYALVVMNPPARLTYC